MMGHGGTTANKKQIAAEAAGERDTAAQQDLLGHRDPSSRLRWLYRFALMLVAGLTIASQIYVQAVIASQRNDAPAINVAGRQRMLSQKLAKLSLRIQNAASHEDQIAAGAELRQALELWHTAHNQLRYGDRDGSGSAVTDPTLEAAFEDLQPIFDRMGAACQRIVDGIAKDESVDDDIEIVMREEKEFLPRMHAIVGMLEGAASDRVETLKHVELVLIVVILLVLVAEALYVFEPAVRTIGSQLEQIVVATKLAAEADAEKRRHEALNQSEKKFRAMFESSRDALMLLDRNGVFDCNDATLNMFGVGTKQDFCGRTAVQFSPPTQPDGEASATAAAWRIDEAFRTGEQRFEWQHVRDNGEIFDAEVLLSRQMEAGQPILQASVRDISERKREEEMLLDARRAAVEANQAKSEFLANMSHEIRTPLNGILGYCELLRRGTADPGMVAEHVETIHASGEHLLALINDVLDLSKIEAGRMTFENIRCSPHAVIRDVLSMLRVKAVEKGLKLESTWKAGVPTTIHSDPARLKQLLINLVGNAIKFTESGQISVTTSAVENDETTVLQVEIEDTGIGIAEDMLDRIFEPFDQADTSITRRFGGTGLGLSICRQIAAGLGGDITVRSESGKGSVFTCRIGCGSLEGVDRTEREAFEAVGELPRHPDITPPCTLEGTRVLLCEDGEVNRRLVKLVLEEVGVEVVEAVHGKQAFEVVQQDLDRFDVVLMDMQMPVMDGYTAATRLKEVGFDRDIIALTAHAMSHDRDKCLAAGCTRYLTKPIDIDELISEIQQSVAARTSKPPSTDGRLVAPESSNEPRVSLPDTTRSPDARPIETTLPTDREEFREIIESFVDKLSETLPQMRAASDRKAWQTMGELAHWLKGAGGTIGFDEFTQPARELEQAAEDGDARAVEASLRQIEDLQSRIYLPWKHTSPFAVS